MAGSLQALQDLGQSVWLDHIQRSFVVDGDLECFRQRYAVTGVTSNPTIFEAAIGDSDEYDRALGASLGRGVDDPEELFWDVATEDVRAAADVLADVHRATDGLDGYVSLELPPRLSGDTAGSIALGDELFRRLDRPNVMIKVPGTPAGVPAVEELTFRGVNVNVTLLFSLSQWRATAEAYLRGLERRGEAGRDLDVSSVASFFISRIDGKANDRLPDDLRNRLGIAAGRLAYGAYLELLSTDRWRALEDHGGRPQRVLFASTSIKDPDLPEGYYVDALAVPGTVNTMPKDTLLAVAEQRELHPPSPDDRAEAPAVARRATDAGVDLEQLGEDLQREGDEKFAASFDALLACIRRKSEQLRADPDAAASTSPLADAIERVVRDLTDRDAVRRLWKRDHTLWSSEPAEVADRLGWLDAPTQMQDHIAELESFTTRVMADRFTHVLVLGMGGSSLFPMVVRDLLATGDGLELHVLDSIDPAAVTRVTHDLPLDSTLVVAASKSGTTVETRNLLDWFWEDRPEPDRFVVVTDPGTPLGALARRRGFRAVFENRPDIGGRYSALSYFGLLPAALTGVDLRGLLERAATFATDCTAWRDPGTNPGLELAVTLAAASRVGRDKLTLVADGSRRAFASWVEQLVAESTGKAGKGLVPVVGEGLEPFERFGDDRLFVSLGGDDPRLDALAEAGHPVLRLGPDEPLDVGAEVVRWEVATALLGAALALNPFDQPDVEAAKEAARSALDGAVDDIEPTRLATILDGIEPGDYVAIQAYVDPAADLVEQLELARQALGATHGVATTLGIGPRYLHSTGQLHKGGPDRLVVLQVVADGTADVAVPGASYSFGELERAQAAGDLHALERRGRRAARVRIDDLLELAEGGTR